MDVENNDASASSAASAPGASGADPLAIIRAQVDALAALAPRDLGGAAAVELFDRAYELSDRLHAIAVRALPVVESDGLWAIGGARTFATWLARRAKITHARAKRMSRLGRALRDELPLTATAVVAAGEDRVGVEQAEILTSVAATSPVRRTALADPDHPVGERFLLEHARLLSADSFRAVARRWASAADPDADDRGYIEASDREFLDLANTTGGCHLSGFLTSEHSQALLVALDAATGKPASGDTRTFAQRRAGALIDLTRTVLDRGLIGAGATVRPHLSVLVDYATLISLTAHAGVDQLLPLPAGTSTGALAVTSTRTSTGTCAGAPVSPAVFEDGQPVPRAVLERLMCDGEVSRIIFGPDSQVINHGRSTRLFTRSLRRAIVARDKSCQYPGCNAPPRLCEGHHTRHWTRDHGETDATTGILLCWHHHARVHDNGVEIQWKVDGGWAFTDRRGQPLTS